MGNKRLLLTIILILAMVLSFSGCVNNKNDITEEVKSYQKIDEIFGTIVTAVAYGENAEEALEKAFDKAKEIENIMSVKKEDSEISYVNNKAAKGEVNISDELFYVIKEGLNISYLSKGAFDISIGKLIDLWGIGTDSAKIPTEEELNMLKQQYNYKNIILNEENKSVQFLNEEIKLDLGAIAKGYAADEMKKILEEAGVSSAILNLGGNVLVVGSKTDGSKWTVGITDPLNSSELKASIKVDDKAVVTSGNYERYFEVDGVRYHHILDPFTAMPAENGVISTTIIADNSMVADALSTATYILAVEESIKLIESLENVEGIFINNIGEIFITSGIEEKDFVVISNED